MTTELTIGAINPGYGGLPIGVAAALGGAQLAWHAHPYRIPEYAGRTIMRYHHPHAGAYTVVDAPPPMVDVLTINGYDDWAVTGTSLIGAGYKPPLVIVEMQAARVGAREIHEYLNTRGYRTACRFVRACDVGAPHARHRTYVIAVRNDCDVPTVNAAHLDAANKVTSSWATPSVDNAVLLETACQWALDDDAGHPNQARTRALEHWEKVTGERYPYPLYSVPTPETQGSLALGFVEWMMGLPIGYVGHPDIDLDRDERLHLLQTGTVPLQAAHAVATGLARMAAS
jgi:DNA (cytosine-5)-methyltransferase 1